jgi:hypothetical protein
MREKNFGRKTGRGEESGGRNVRGRMRKGRVWKESGRGEEER